MNEKYIPLYRKYRPQTLEEVVGQEHVKKALANAISLNKIAHAYLFTGPRGTGKTSTARILAKSLNCVEGPTVKPCGKCVSCVDIANSTPIDVVEIDAASNRSVNDAQNILEKIQYAPVNGKYKIYIIDEVHMLTVQAFNALLKTLEEPPENVVFILATTEVHKVLDTIKSRCQRFDFKRITTADIVKHLKHVAELENINIEDDAILTIAKNSAGGMRDSLALLDQLSVLDVQKAITTDDINSLLGRLSFDVLKKISECIIASKPNDAIEILEEIYNSGNEPSQILLNLLNYFKNLLIVKNCKSDLILDLTQTTEFQAEYLKKQVESLETQQIVFLIDRTSHYIQELKTTTNQHLWLEVALIDLANLSENSKLIDLQERISRLEGGEIPAHQTTSNYKTPPHPVQKPSMRPASPQVVSQNALNANYTHERVKEDVQIKKESVETPQKEQNEQPQSVETSVDTEKLAYAKADLTTMWHELLANITSKPTQALLQQLAHPVEISPESVVITLKQENFVKQWNDSNKKQAVIDAVDILFGQKNSNVVIRLPQPSDSEIIKKNAMNNTPKIQPKTVEQNIKKDVVQNVNQTAKQEIPQDIAKTQPKETKVEKVIEKRDIEKPTDNPDMVELVEVDVETEKVRDIVLSDQAQMVKDLFEGKIIE